MTGKAAAEPPGLGAAGDAVANAAGIAAPASRAPGQEQDQSYGKRHHGLGPSVRRFHVTSPCLTLERVRISTLSMCRPQRQR